MKDITKQVEDFVNGKLNASEHASFEQRMQGDSDLQSAVEEHVKVIEALKLYGRRQSLLNTLQQIPLNTPDTNPVISVKTDSKTWKRLWPMTAVAASVALISILGTLYLTQDMADQLETKQTAYYKELRRNVEQIQKSQSIIIADIASKENPTPLPGRYAGSGFLVSGNGYVVTSYHVVKGADSVYIENENFGRLKTTVVLNDKENDVSVLRIESPAFKAIRSMPFTVSASEANLGEDVFTLGFPREDIVFGEGAISAITGYQQNPNAYQVSVPVNPGNSGGPLFNTKGDLVGIISGLQTQTSGAAFATKSSVLLDVIKELPVDTIQAPLVLPKQNMLRHLSKVDQIKKWKEYVFIVRVYNNK